MQGARYNAQRPRYLSPSLAESSHATTKTRDLEIPTLYRTTTATTTTQESTTFEYEKVACADAHIQTSVQSVDGLPDEPQATDGTSGVVSHHEIPFSRFTDVLLGGSELALEVEEASCAAIENEKFLSLRHSLTQRINDAVKEGSKDYSYDDYSDDDEDDAEQSPLDNALIAFLNFLLYCIQEDADHQHRLDYEFLGAEHFHPQRRHKGENAFHCVGVETLDEASESHQYGWENCVLVIDFSTESPTHPPDSSNAESDRLAQDSHLSPVSPYKPPPTLLRWASSTMGALGNRRFIIGISIIAFEARLWYFDRAGTLCTPSVHIFDHLFLETMVRLSLASLGDLGFEEMLFSSESYPDIIQGSQVIIEGRAFALDDVVHTSDDVYGRGTVVFKAHPLPIMALYAPSMPPKAVPDQVIVKLAWQLTDSSHEDEMYRLAEECGVEGVANLYCSSRLLQLSQTVRGRLIASTLYRDRQLRAQVTGPVGVPLSSLKDLETFKKAFVSLVKAHRELYSKTGILHHDISLANLMVRSDDHSVGILIDLDVAVRIKDGHRDVPFKPVPGGTIPFRAVELLRDEPATKLFYRYDLESFFYVLVWILTYSETGFSAKRDTLEDWHKGGWRVFSSGKRAFMSTDWLLPLGPLTEVWLAPLRRMFYEGFKAESRAITSRSIEALDQETLDGNVTYERFMNIITEGDTAR